MTRSLCTVDSLWHSLSSCPLLWHCCHREPTVCVCPCTHERVTSHVRTCPEVFHYIVIPSCVKTLVTCQTWTAWWCHTKQPKEGRAHSLSGPTLAVWSGYCFLAFQLFEHLAEIVSGGCAVSPRLAPCRPSHWQEIRLHQYVWEVQRDLRDGSYFSWSSTQLPETDKKLSLCTSVCMCVSACVMWVGFRDREREIERPVHTDQFVWECINIYVGWICKTVGTKANNSGAAVHKRWYISLTFVQAKQDLVSFGEGIQVCVTRVM